MTKLYSSKGNAKRAAIKELGPHSIEGIDYRLTQKGRKWTWIDKAAPAAGSENASAETGPTDQPATAAEPARERRTRADSKQAKVIEMLRRPEGATIAQIAEATGWQRHTVRGAISGALKKKLGLTVTSEKAEDGDRVYRIIDAA